jgi:hypothetical protein
MAEYKNIPVDAETKEMLAALCQAYGRKQGAQVKQMVRVEFEKLQQVKAMVAEVLPKGGVKRARNKAVQVEKPLAI